MRPKSVNSMERSPRRNSFGAVVFCPVVGETARTREYPVERVIEGYQGDSACPLRAAAAAVSDSD